MFPLGAVIETKIKKVRALCRLGISENGCMRERCRPPQTIVIVGIKGDKERSTTTWNKSGLNNISKFVFWLSDIYRLFWVFLRPSFGACAPPSPNSRQNLNYLRRVGRLLMIILPSGNLFRRMRATFPQFVVKLKLSPQSGKTFNDNSARRKPLSARGATLPERESFSAKWEDFLVFRLGFWIETAKSVPTRRTVYKYWTESGEMPSPRLVI